MMQEPTNTGWCYKMKIWIFVTILCWTSVFPLSRFFSANRRVVGGRANNFWQYSKYNFGKFDKFVEIWHLVYFNTGLVQNFGHINVFLELWTQLFKENLGTRRLAIKLEGTQLDIAQLCKANCHQRNYLKLIRQHGKLKVQIYLPVNLNFIWHIFNANVNCNVFEVEHWKLINNQ